MTVPRRQTLVTPMMEAAGEASVLRKVNFHWKPEIHLSFLPFCSHMSVSIILIFHYSYRFTTDCRWFSYESPSSYPASSAQKRQPENWRGALVLS